MVAKHKVLIIYNCSLSRMHTHSWFLADSLSVGYLLLSFWSRSTSQAHLNQTEHCDNYPQACLLYARCCLELKE